MIRGCSICQRAPATKAVCCGQKFCVDHELTHPCPRSAELHRIASDPKLLRQWRAENAPEEELTTQVIAALNRLPGVFVWQGRKRGGFKANDAAKGLPDVIGYAAPGALFIGVETKRNHKDGCGCDSCSAQREWGALLAAAGGVYVPAVRTAQAAVDGVRLGLAKARARSAA